MNRPAAAPAKELHHASDGDGLCCDGRSDGQTAGGVDIYSTPGALRALEDAGQQPLFFLTRHISGDWGCLDAEDKAANDQALIDGTRIFSAYKTLKGERLWVITEAVGDDSQRASTTILLPEEY